MSKPIRRQSKEIVYNVYMYFKERKNDKSSQEYQNDINLAKTVSVATGLSERTAEGHTVLRLPPYHPDLNPIELVWGDLKGELARTAIDSNLDKKKEVLISLFTNYSAEKWFKCDDHVIKNELEYYETDRVFDDEIDRLIINLGEDTDTDYDQDDDEEIDMDCGYN
ncbi:unnamed protein product [Parnassius apollo]|uniref:(apollo) hypothetical protein n=1 Tax=Parnassius apollo TaxID=110799 RepID=A0A8S3XQM4_PARAO|nr:unnamed protein product [Parnassius apollo]